MANWSLQEVLEATGGESTSSLILAEHQFACVSTDSRQVSPGSLFVPLVGAQHDGHEHVQAALQQGALASLWAQPGEPPQGLPLIRVADTLAALQGLGRFHLKRRIGCPVVAITGSTGKTTTKDLLACLLGTRYKVLKTPGNYNNDVGVPLTLLQLEPGTGVAVLEIAMRGAGQIARLARLLEPQVGLITNIGLSHIELLGSQENIARAKGELFECMEPESLAVVPRDSEFYAFLSSLARGPQVSFSGRAESSADVSPLRCVNRGLDGWLVEFERGVEWHLPLPGEHHVEDLAAAWAVAKHLQVDPVKAGEALRTVRLSHLRMERHDLPNGLCLLNDAYNAAPDSMRSALQVLGFAPGRKIAVLGDMLELGDMEQQAHEQLGQWVAEIRPDHLVAVGQRSRWMLESAQRAGLTSVEWAADVGVAGVLLREQLKPGDTLLLKASRGVGLDRLVPELERWQP